MISRRRARAWTDDLPFSMRAAFTTRSHARQGTGSFPTPWAPFDSRDGPFCTRSVILFDKSESLYALCVMDASKVRYFHRVLDLLRKFDKPVQIQSGQINQKIAEDDPAIKHLRALR